jgi:hypothetical protein
MPSSPRKAVARLRHQQGRGQPSRPRIGRGTCSAGPREWRRPGNRRAGFSAMFPRDRVIASARQIQYSLLRTKKPTDSLVTKLAQFYADRTLTKSPITPADQAEAYLPPRKSASEQNHRPGHHRRRRSPRGLPPLNIASPTSRVTISPGKFSGCFYFFISSFNVPSCASRFLSPASSTSFIRMLPGRSFECSRAWVTR